MCLRSKSMENDKKRISAVLVSYRLITRGTLTLKCGMIIWNIFVRIMGLKKKLLIGVSYKN